ncbi:class I SAM-dependent methyltransferase [Tropicibacter naphthalenivorans]|uniref:Bifunctional 3-demethylubiquinone-9 3-methyltransferase/ 2-octaprenyl-6-hydroxy phenol methylase n=1 Tax=Tropicibacter naphthalenivorans TaxID=441103 RepID=A0A0N7M1A0_9RHOB|nr:methyltransferase domain-containing protein [Tropicibacter naphthalenivorans]CUH82681.1 bifunctional 3-demethylubiquinone-9 3-methyltransferase/ 2-octaprenyl-6-hydroxy phenol methylase [Tropicibacter naphthalenivorans]SMD11138.1 Methyltransferase domain-containing protein [Tropicibacter naphthalenivorans]
MNSVRVTTGYDSQSAAPVPQARVRALLDEGHPRMVGKADLGRLLRVASALPENAVIVEMGPWLGWFSHALAAHGQLHVVDTFRWTADHDRRVPQMIAPGDSFRALFEAIMAACGASATVHETSFADFTWSGTETGTETGAAIDLLVIDSPKSPEALKDCLLPVLTALKPGATVLIKNGLNPKQYEMMGYVEALVGRDLFRFAKDNDPSETNILALERTGSGGTELLDTDASAPDDVAVTLGAAQVVARCAAMLSEGNLAGALALLERQPADPDMIRLWDATEPSITGPDLQPLDLAVFADLLTRQNDPLARAEPAPKALSSGPMAPVRAFWQHHAGQPWRCRALKPALLQRAQAFGYMAWPDRIADFLPGRAVIDLGCGSGLHGLGYLAHGAVSVVGIDPALEPTRDRVKNLRSRRREGFGWTPEQIMQDMPVLKLRSESIADQPAATAFDLAILHDCLAHVDDPEAALAKAAALLRPGGRVVIRHKNFYGWTGHSGQPKTVDAFDPTDPAQAAVADWGHLSWQAPEDHYIRRSLNRVRLGDLVQSIERHFTIETLTEHLATEKTGLGRLTDAIRARHPDLDRRDFDTHWIFCTAVVK